jgi:hypothetical protein
LESLSGKDVEVANTLGAQDLVGKAGALAQDIFGALIVSQRRVEGGL